MSGSVEDHKLLKSIPRETLLPSHNNNNNQLNDQADVITSGAQENVDCLWTPEEVAFFAYWGQFHLRIFCSRV
jgi:hypothetical protein